MFHVSSSKVADLLKLLRGAFTTEAGEKATQYRNVFAVSFVLFVLACVRTLFTTWAPLGSIYKVVAYLGAQVLNSYSTHQETVRPR